MDLDDCDDDNPDVYPGAQEGCDYLDNDCDGDIDEVDGDGLGVHWDLEDPRTPPLLYVDADGDTYGSPTLTRRSCTVVSGYVSPIDGKDDCDDTSSAVWPGATERCNGLDDNCDGVLDENSAVDAAPWYPDLDADLYGDGLATPVAACSAPSGYVSDAADCDDGLPGVNPGMTEIPADGLDNDCDGGSNGYGLDGEHALAGADALYYGADAGYFAGYSLAESADLDGDGEPDLAVGAPYADDGAPSAGAVYVVSAAELGNTALSGGSVVRYGEAVYDGVGTAIAAADLDNDGRDDLIVGAPGDDSAGDDGGAVWLLTGLDLGQAAVSADPTQGRFGSAGAGLGQSLFAGDPDGDGLAEVLVGAPDADTADGADAGLVVLYAGDGVEMSRWEGEAARDEAGAAITMGDLDGDGVAEILVGAPSSQGGAGAVYVLVGAPASLADAEVLLTGISAADRGGSALTLGDTDGDGLADLWVGAPDNADGAVLGGAVYLLTDPLGRSGTRSLSDSSAVLLGVESGQHIGSALAANGDLDGDGWLDVLVGAAGSDAVATDAGEVLVVFGPTAAGTLEARGRLQGESSSSYAGCSVGFAHDPLGVGFDDALMGVYGYDRGGFAAGAVARFGGGSL